MSPHALRALLIPAVALFAASLFFPVFVCRSSSGHMGYDVLWAGWMAILALDPRWLANPAAIWVVYRLARGRTSDRVAGVACAAGLLALLCVPIPALSCGMAGGAPDLSLGLRTGGYLWVVSIVWVSALGVAAWWNVSSQASED